MEWIIHLVSCLCSLSNAHVFISNVQESMTGRLLVYLILCVCTKHNHIIVSRLAAEAWIVHLYSPGLRATSSPLCLFVTKVTVGLLTCLHWSMALHFLVEQCLLLCPQCLNKALLFLQTGFLLREYEFSPKHLPLMHFLRFNKVCSHY